ncbi:MAG: PAS domain-containing protein [Candidatus Diapherotrites archaeon]|nr:PAS domain-containing protein [Candidatus Diapherotrites archaeon]
MLDRETENRILDFIVNVEQPMHSAEIAKALDINRVTVSKYLSVLHSRGLIEYRNIGMAKVWMAVENPILQAFEKNDVNNPTIQAFNSLSEGVSVLDKEMNVIWLNRAMEARHGKLNTLKSKKCYEVFHNETAVCKNCPTLKTLESGKRAIATIQKPTHTLEISTSPLKSPKGRFMGIIEIVRVLDKGKKESAVPGK